MNKNLNKKIWTSIYIILMTIAFTTRYGDYKIGNTLQYLIGLFLIFLSFFSYLLSRKKPDTTIINFIKLYFIPLILIHLYSIILTFLGYMDKDFLSTNVSVYIPVLLAISSVQFLGKNAFKYNCIALVLSWILSVTFSLLTKGVYIFPHAIIQAYINPYTNIGGLTRNYLELHDLVLSLGYVVIYYLYSKDKLLKKDIIAILFIISIILLGIKRISMLGIVFSFIFMKIIKKMPINLQKVIIKLAGIAIFVGSYLFIFILSQGNEFFEFLASLNINVMGRNYYYQAIMNYGEFSISFFGIGRNAVTKLMTGPLSYMRVAGVHSDILKMYIENGFIVFGIWLWYYLIKIPKKYIKYYNFKTALLYVCVMIYTFTLYFTDNTENYFMCQIFSIIILMDYVLKIKNDEKNG